MSTHDVDGLNAGYARALLDEYLENPEAVPSEWRALFESGDSALVATHPGIARLLEKLGTNGTNGHAEAPPPAGDPVAPRRVHLEIATVVGALPLVLAGGPGSASRATIGIVVIFGVSFSTLLSLFVVPAFYALLAKYTHSPEAVAHELEKLEAATPQAGGHA